jgi:hypothetical protein
MDMAFALWIDEAEGLAWTQGTHEYRPLGAAVISVTDQFRLRDFRKTVRHPSRLNSSFAGFYASIEDVNRVLRQRQRGIRKKTTPHYVR